MKREVANKLINALLLMVMDPHIREFLAKHDRAGLKQALSALADAGYPDATPTPGNEEEREEAGQWYEDRPGLYLG